MPAAVPSTLGPLLARRSETPCCVMHAPLIHTLVRPLMRHSEHL